ncbi:hypothetical protein K1719_017039 [Acacia pycnantha]|nr:hypothetical protein K1719_017039 [Acacia pycnantha]
MTSVGNGGQKQQEVVISESDFKIAKEGEIPSIEFSNAIRDLLAKGMEKSLIIKLLGRSITYHDLAARTQFLWRPRGSYKLVDMEGSFYCATFDLEEDYMKVLTGGPWMIYGAYLTVQPWSLNFDSKTAIVSKVVAWIRILGLSIRYYHKSTLRAIGTLLGDVVKIDYMTETTSAYLFSLWKIRSYEGQVPGEGLYESINLSPKGGFSIGVTSQNFQGG